MNRKQILKKRPKVTYGQKSTIGADPGKEKNK